ncbi:MAG TPA: hypothetical protein PK137_00470 [Anaerolineaceae bacterium]|nr:hypothetical protein [Anaerolineaceae bacterium]HOR83974.1 hypothetical protein [Anaerolineaceae bacterium]HPL42310.1 hypothetical protein [Anaerolineaceae bacterium]HPY33202.1 hypothetical protein [Anaerolineaceae bacterium]
MFQTVYEVEALPARRAQARPNQLFFPNPRRANPAYPTHILFHASENVAL